MKRLFIFLCCAALMAGSTPSASAFEDNSFEAATADVIVVRPACFVATILGSAIFLVALPVAAISGSVHETADALVATPARNTFTRPIGELSTLGE